MTRVITPNGLRVRDIDAEPRHWPSIAALLLLASFIVCLLAGYTSARVEMTHADAARVVRELAAAGQIADGCTPTTCLITTPRTNP